MEFTGEDLVRFKDEMNWTWDVCAEKLGVEPRTVFYYIDKKKEKRHKIPGSVIKLIRLYRLLKAKGMLRYV